MAGEKKIAYIRKVVSDCQALAILGREWANYDNEYFDNTYGAAGADEITDANMAPYDMTAAQFTNLITLMQNFEKLRTNQTPTTGDYASHLHAILRAPV